MQVLHISSSINLYTALEEREIYREKTHISESWWGLTARVETHRNRRVREGICEFDLAESFERLGKVTGHNLTGEGSQGFVFNLETQNETFTFNSQSEGSENPGQ